MASSHTRSRRALTTSFYLAAFLAVLPAIAPSAFAQERRAYEGVVSWKKRTIGTVILAEVRDDHSVAGWILLGKFEPIQDGTATENGMEFKAAGNTYKIDERRGKITYSGPDGEGDRLAGRLTPLTGRLQELLEATLESGSAEAVLDSGGRSHVLKYNDPALWKRDGPPFEKYSRMEELLGQNITVWLSDSDERSGVIVAIEEPKGMDIPLKVPKKPKDDKGKK